MWGDWDTPYATLQPVYEAAQIKVFGQMVTKGHIYRGKKPVNLFNPHIYSLLSYFCNLEKIAFVRLHLYFKFHFSYSSFSYSSFSPSSSPSSSLILTLILSLICHYRYHHSYSYSYWLSGSLVTIIAHSTGRG